MEMRKAERGDEMRRIQKVLLHFGEVPPGTSKQLERLDRHSIAGKRKKAYWRCLGRLVRLFFS
eukprot:278948-Prorocentrum_minimum.AAC.3